MPEYGIIHIETRRIRLIRFEGVKNILVIFILKIHHKKSKVELRQSL